MSAELQTNKPLYRKWWFWVIVVVVLVCIAGTASNNNDKHREDNSDNISESDAKDPIEAKADTIRKKAEKVLKDRIIAFTYKPENNYLYIEFRGMEGFSHNSTVEGFYTDIFDTLQNIQDEVDTDVEMVVNYPLQNKYGETSDVKVITADFRKDTVKRINFNNAAINSIPQIADEWLDIPAVRLEK